MGLTVYIDLDLPTMSAARNISVSTADADAPVAGTIGPAAPDDLALALEQWLAHLTVQGRSANTVRQYRSMFARVRRETGWSRLSQITYAGIIAYLDSRRKGWRAETYNANLTAFRSFCRHLCRLDPHWTRVVGQMNAADRCTGHPSDGARAATTEEARHLVEAAAARCLDGRSKTPRPLIYKTLFLAGLRGEEPGSLLWRHVLLDDDVPHIWWGGRLGAAHKAKRQQRVAMLPELADLLRRHRAECGHAGPDDRVFPRLPNRLVWDSDREIAGIQKLDDRGRPFTRHSARKWLATTLASHAVDGKYVDWFMRHRGKVEARYFDPLLADQAAVLRTLPLFFCDSVESFPEDADDEAGLAARAHGPLEYTTGSRPSAAAVLASPSSDAVVTAEGLDRVTAVSASVTAVQVREEIRTITPIIELILRSKPSREELATAFETLAALIRHP
jgi:integrase